jgi:acetyltransferase-like isoleucine patch superfamily enzyme
MTIYAETPYEGKVAFLWDQADCYIGKYCSLADGITIYLGGNHRPDLITTCTFEKVLDAPPPDGHPATKGDVHIGNDVWLGSNVTIMSGVTVGTGAIIGTRSVVASDIPFYAIAAGNPAEVVRYRFAPAIIQTLLATQWWNWPLDVIRDNLALLRSEPRDEVLAQMIRLTAKLASERRLRS